MTNIYHIAKNTFREAVRDRVLYVILFFALVMVLASRAIGWISVGQQEQVVTHFSLAIISLFGALIAVFIGTNIIYKEIEKRTIYTILSKPVERWEFIFGKFAGLAAVLFGVIMAMGTLVGLYLHFGVGGSVSVMFFEAVVLIFFEMMVVTAIAILFSTVASPILSAIFTFCAYLLGQVTPDLLSLVTFTPEKESVAQYTGEHLTDFVSTTHWILAPIAKVMYWLLPNLTYFHARNRVVFGPALTKEEFALAILYAMCYSLALLIVSSMLFTRKRF